MFTDEERGRLAAALDELVPGCSALGAVEYVERLLTALDHDPPRLWAGPGSWAGGSGQAAPRWIDPGPWERHAWAQRIDGWRAVYQRVIAGTPEPGDRHVLHGHACEATYGDPAYGGNAGSGGWAGIGFPEPIFPPARDGDGDDG